MHEYVNKIDENFFDMSFATFGIFFYLHFVFIFQGPSKIMKNCCSTTT